MSNRWLENIGSGLFGFIAGRASAGRSVGYKTIVEPSYVASYDIQDRDDYEKCFMLAQGYIESAIALCMVLSDDNFDHEWPHGSAVMFLYFHAFELFYKAAILQSGAKMEEHHRIDKLRDKYKSIYSSGEYDVPDSFIIQAIGMDSRKLKKGSQQQRATIYKKMDKFFRYPFDKGGEPWPGIWSFEPAGCLRELKEAQAAFSRIASLINKSDQAKN